MAKALDTQTFTMPMAVGWQKLHLMAFQQESSNGHSYLPEQDLQAFKGMLPFGQETTAQDLGSFY